MRIATLGSGSGGNATLLMDGDEAVLVDCGLSVRQVEARLATLAVDPVAIRAVLLTHEHDDHIAGAGAFSRKYGVPLHLSAGTRIAAASALGQAHACVDIVPGETFALGVFSVAPVIVPHDAREPCQFVIAAGARRIGVLTDIGQLTTHVVRHFSALDALMLEFNHEPGLLAASAYPAGLKQRIGGDYGHLSNQQAVTLLERIDAPALRHVIAAHLSEKTNTPDCVAGHLSRCLPAHVGWTIATQHAASPWCVLD